MKKVGIVGGGVAGSTIALRLAGMGVRTVLVEQGESLVNGPPMCHLHAGGNLYRELDDAQCLALLKQSVDTARAYPFALNHRPTVIAIPLRDGGSVDSLLPRLRLLQRTYGELVHADPRNGVLGEPEDYFRLYDREALEELASRDIPDSPVSQEDWLIPVAKSVDLSKFVYPWVMVQEYGLSLFRIAASANMALGQTPFCELLTCHRLTNLTLRDNGSWDMVIQGPEGARTEQVDFVVNACGYRTGEWDNALGVHRQRLVEFKSAYLANWQEQPGSWPEVIFHGERGTPTGMAQFTPYPDGLVQLHGMTEDITLFDGGRVYSSETSAQPELPDRLARKLTLGWHDDVVQQRTRQAIVHMAELVPGFASAKPGGKPLFGAQQVPGNDITLRASDISFAGKNYVRAEIIKASSAIVCAEKIARHLVESGWDMAFPEGLEGPELSLIGALDEGDIEFTACKLAVERGYPASLAKSY
ncbi:FAD-dependent oxidoreductase [Parasalinivibrio latis]|uniref:FAD-dependent oxidoreductase n=1 Tax=Parasalinivibrio latis TaxID=2952610 RepID=UPI0030E388EC